MKQGFICPCCNTNQHPELMMDVPEPVGDWGIYIAKYYFCPIMKERYADEKLRELNDSAMMRVKPGAAASGGDSSDNRNVS